MKKKASKARIIKRILLTLGVVMTAAGVIGISTYFLLTVKEKKLRDEINDEFLKPRAISVDGENARGQEEKHLLPVEIADIGALKEINPEVEGFVQIDDTSVAYPVVLSDPPDKYLHRDLYGRYAFAGTVFMEPLSPKNPENIILYGHHMRTGTMFTPIMNYRDPAWAADHTIAFYTDRYGIAAYSYLGWAVVRAGDTAFRKSLFFKGNIQAGELEEQIKSKGYLKEGEEIGGRDRLLTLSTCEYSLKNGRLYVFFKEVDYVEKTDDSLSDSNSGTGTYSTAQRTG